MLKGHFKLYMQDITIALLISDKFAVFVMFPKMMGVFPK